MKTRRCSTCKQDLPEDDEHFAMRYDRKKPQFQTTCKKCQAEYRKKHYEDNKQKYIDKAARYTITVVKWFEDLKSTLVCAVCGESRWWVLDFHHRDPTTKEGNISVMKRRGSRKALLEEIEKCDVLCSNCHRDLHYKERLAE